MRDSPFSTITNDIVDIAGESNHQYWWGSSMNLKTRERGVDFLPSEPDTEILAMKFHTTVTNE